MIEDLLVPEKDTDRKKWAEQLADRVGLYSHGAAWNTIRYNYEDRFRKWKGDLELGDYEHIHSTLGKPKPMLFANYPLFAPLIQEQVGEYSSRPVPFGINRINKNAYSDYLNMQSNLVLEKILSPVWARIEKEQGVKLPIEQKMQMIPEQFQSMPHKSIRDQVEVTMKYGINYLYHTYKFGGGFSQNLYDIMINDDCFSKIELYGNDPVIEHIPIQNAIFQVGEDNYIFDEVHKRSPFMGKDVWMTLDGVISRYGHRMTKDQKKALLDDNTKMRANPDAMTGFNNECGGYTAYRKADGGIYQCRVLDFEVKAINKKKFLKAPYQPDKEEIYDSRTVNEVWEICKLGRVHLEPRKRKNQIPNKGNYFDNQFSYFGTLSRHSFFRSAWPVQLLWNTSWQTLDFLLNQSGGKAARMATERKPDNKEWSDIAWQMKVLGVIEEQIRVGDTGGRSTMGGEVDFGPSASIQYIIQMIQLLKTTAEGMTGVSKARQGQGASTAPGVSLQSSIIQSTYATKPIYDVLTTHSETGLQRCMDLIVYLWDKDETKSYIGGDGLPQVFKWIAVKDIRNRELGIYMDSAMQKAQEKDAIMELMRPLSATDATMILETIKVFNAESGAEAEQILEHGIGTIRKNMEAMEKAKIQVGQKANELTERELDLRERELKIKETIPVKVAGIHKESAENVQMLKNEESEKSAIIANRGALDQQQLEAVNAPEQVTESVPA